MAILRKPPKRQGVEREPLFALGERHLPLNRWDEEQLERYAGRAGALEPLRAAIATGGVKLEQETIQHRLYAVLTAAG